MEKALRAYFEKLKKAKYAHSFGKANTDEEMISMVDDGLEEYLKIITEE